MIIKGIEVTKFKWNDKEVSEEEYLRLDEEWKKEVERMEASEKNFQDESPKKRKSSRSPRK